MKVVISPRSQSKIDILRQQLPHAIILVGDQGVGLGTVAKELAAGNLAGIILPVDSKGNHSHETGTISVDAIRHLYDQTRAKQTKPHIYIIDDAERMSPGAQAALLKLLEEPNQNTHFILTSHSLQSLLPTVRSRLQAITIEPITAQQTTELIDTLKVTDARKKQQLEYLASGRPAELTRLARDDSYFRQSASIMMDTRTFLTGTMFEKLLIVNQYQKDRAKTLQLLDGAMAVTKRSLADKPQSMLVEQLEHLLAAREKVESNCSNRLQLLAFVVQ